MEYDHKEVYFDRYCKTCKNFKKDENQEPCDECLSEPTNLHSHKPVKWEKNVNAKEERED